MNNNNLISQIIATVVDNSDKFEHGFTEFANFELYINIENSGIFVDITHKELQIVNRTTNKYEWEITFIGKLMSSTYLNKILIEIYEKLNLYINAKR